MGQTQADAAQSYPVSGRAANYEIITSGGGLAR
jgi:hypothetical protein